MRKRAILLSVFIMLLALGFMVAQQNAEPANPQGASSQNSNQPGSASGTPSSMPQNDTGTSPQNSDMDASSGKHRHHKGGSDMAGEAMSDQKFVEKAAQGGAAEVELGKLAADKASDPQVKQFGQRMVDDHSKANDQLKDLAQRKNITISAQPDAKEQKEKDKLSSLSGAEFDRAYMRHMLRDHKKDVAEFKKEANSGKDNDVKQFASQTLPTLQDHLKQAQQLAKSERGSKKSQPQTSAKSSGSPTGSPQK